MAKPYTKIMTSAIILALITLFISGCAPKSLEPESSTEASPTQSITIDNAGTPVPTVSPTPATNPTPSPESVQQEVQPPPSKTASTETTVTETADVQDKHEEGILSIEGSGAKQAIQLGMQDIKAMQQGCIEDDYFSLNNYGTKKYFHFKGVSIWYLLNEHVGLKPSASKVTFVADDGYALEYAIEDVKRDDYMDEQNPEKKYKMIVAWEEDGKEYDPEEGTPLKLVVGQKEPGDINKPNWIQSLRTIVVE